MARRIKRSDFVDGDAYAQALRRDGVGYQHLVSGKGFGTGVDAKILEAVYGANWEKTVEQETNDAPPMPHVFKMKYSDKRRGRKKK
jgi:hypothetical protein